MVQTPLGAYFVLEEMERRLLYSAETALLTGDLGTVPVLTTSDYGPVAIPLASAQMHGSADVATSPALRHEIVFIDSGIEDAQGLAFKFTAQGNPQRILEVVLIDASQDGVAQISAVLATRNDLDAIHIMSHGGDGELQLGSTRLDNATLLGNAISISAWGASLANAGDILLYGCDVAQTSTGQKLVDAIGRLTGADIAASANLTGNTLLQGDWVLEYSSGQVETVVVADAQIQSNYRGILATHLVSNTADSGAGSLRQAIIDANANGGADEIHFGIASGIITLTSALPSLTGATIIDGRTAAGYIDAPTIGINGNAIDSAGLTFESGSGGSAVYGLSIVNFTGAGIWLKAGSNANVIEGNYIGVHTDGSTAWANHQGILISSDSNTIGGTTAASRNVVSGNLNDGIVVGGANNTISGNHIGTDAAGNADLGNLFSGVKLLDGAADNIIGGLAAGSGNLISGNENHGIYVENATGSRIQGNLIGLNADGSAAIGNAHTGLTITLANSGITVGGTTASARNVISGNGRDGIETKGANGIFQGNYIGTDIGGIRQLANLGAGIGVFGDNVRIGGTDDGAGNLIAGNGREGLYISATLGVIVQGNSIGTDINGAALANGMAPIIVASGSNHQIGGSATNAGNIIANSSTNGVTILDGTSSVLILGNSIYNSANLGIDLGHDNVTGNDVGDSDTGANDLQNFPVVAAAWGTASSTTIEGSLNSKALRSYRIEFFSNGPIHSLHGEGKTFIGSVDVTTDASGNATFSATLPGAFTIGQWISATATDSSANETSEFSLSSRVQQLNAAPVGADKAIVLAEDTPYVFDDDDFGFSDPQNVYPDSFQAVLIVTLPSNGTLTNNGTALTAGSVVSVSDIVAGGLIFTAAGNANGANLTNLTFRVQDSGGTAFGGEDTDMTVRAITFSVDSINDAPSGTANTVSMAQDQGFTFAAEDFGFADPDDMPGDRFVSLVIDSVPTVGLLELAGTVVNAGDAVNMPDIVAGKLRYTPAAAPDSPTDATFTFRVRDDGGTANGGVDTDPTSRLMTIVVTPVATVTPAPSAPSSPPAPPAPVISGPQGETQTAPTQAGGDSASEIGVIGTLPTISPTDVAPHAGTAPGPAGQANPTTNEFALSPKPADPVQGSETPLILQDTVHTLGAASGERSNFAADTGNNDAPDNEPSHAQPGESRQPGRETTAAARRLDIAVDARDIRARISSFLDVRIEPYKTSSLPDPGPSDLVSAADVQSYFEQILTTQAVVVRHEDALALKKIASTDSSFELAPVPRSSQEMEQQYREMRVAGHRIETAVFAGMLTAAWAVSRKAALIASLLATVPGWLRLDPLPILASTDEPESGSTEAIDEDKEAESVENIFEVTQAAPCHGNRSA